MLTQIRRSVVAAAVVLSMWSFRSEACGCFATTTTSTPVVQAGERILFAVNQGVVTAHIQIQYAGDPTQFGWLLPLPSVPTLKVGSDQLFAQLEARTAPSYTLTSTPTCQRQSFTFGCASPSLSGGARGNEMHTAPSPLVTEGSVGPYEYAVLDASDQNAMLGWLTENRYVIPNGTAGALAPYVHPGAYFLALKLQSGKSTGDLAPVVVSYASDAPMIPLILTAVAAVPGMGIKVWLLGSKRGVPRNFHHVVINDAVLAWRDEVSNYAQVVTAAVAEAPEKHAFVTEYAGSSTVMSGVLADSARFGNERDFTGITNPYEYLLALYAHRFAQDEALTLDPALVRMLIAAIPRTPENAHIGDLEFLSRLDLWFPPSLAPEDAGTVDDAGTIDDAGVSQDGGTATGFDPVALTATIFRDYVTPLREANALFDAHPYLTRLFTTLSPQDMTADPVFGFNENLPPVALEHAAAEDVGCDRSVLVTPQGWRLDGRVLPAGGSMPSAWKVEVLREEGAPEVVTDNTDPIVRALPPGQAATKGGGCSVVVDPLTLVAVALLAMRRRRQTS